MFYRPGAEAHGLPHDPLKACVAPRPIGWISTVSADGRVNLAPYSFFNMFASSPPVIGYCSNGRTPFGAKDTVSNIEATGQFVYSMATWDLREAMNESSAPVAPDVDEFQYAGLEAAPSTLVKPPRVAASPIAFECELHQVVELPSTNPDARNVLVLGKVVGVHISDDVLNEGLVDLTRVKPIARLGYRDYAVVEKVFSMNPPRVGS